jgi:Ribbon-helix-helix protein, copG family
MNMPRRRGPTPANPEQPITLTMGFAASEADRKLVERLAAATGARSISEAIRGAIRNEFARAVGNASA